MANYVVTFTDKNCIDNLIKVWIPTLKQTFDGNKVVITFDVSENDILRLKEQGITVIEEDKSISGMFKSIENRLKVEKKFIETLNDTDKIMLIDGADVVFQSEINTFFDNIKSNKIYYSTTGTLSNKPTISWMRKLVKDLDKDFMDRLKKQKIIASGMLAGSKIAFLKFFEDYKTVKEKAKIKYFCGLNQAILTYLVMTEPEKFEKTDIHNCRVENQDVIREDGIYKIHKTIPIIHFSCEKMKDVYRNSYLNAFTEKSKNNLNILWLYGSNEKFDKINHWYHTGFAKIINNLPNVNLMMYGYKMTEVWPDLAKIQFNKNIKGKDLKKEFDFDVIIMDNKNRFAYTQTLKERKAKVPRIFWLKPDFFDGLDDTPKIFLEGDYHLHFRMARPDEENWYQKMKIDLLLVRHLSALDYHKDNSMPIAWFPCSVDTNIFRPNPDIERKNKICLISGYGKGYYSYRNTAGNLLEPLDLIDIYNERFIGDDYIKNLQSYVSHLSGSSIRAITPAKMFEYMASGTLLFTDAGDEYGLRELFPDGSYVTYNKKDYSDVIPKARMIINDKDFRKEVTNKALKCIKERHTHEIRGQELIDLITSHFKIDFNNKPDNSLIGNIKDFLFKKEQKQYNIIKTIGICDSTEKEKLSIETDKVHTELEMKDEDKNEKLIRKLYNKKIDIYLLKDTCYNVIINNKIGGNLTITTNKRDLSKEILGEDYKFDIKPENVKKFIYKDMILYVPCPIITYLKSLYGEEILKIMESKRNRLMLINNIYKFVKRK